MVLNVPEEEPTGQKAGGVLCCRDSADDGAEQDHDDRKVSLAADLLHEQIRRQQQRRDAEIGDGDSPIELGTHKAQVDVDVVGPLALHRRRVPHVGTIQIGEEVDDAAGEEDAQVEFAHEPSLLGFAPVFNGVDLFCVVLAGV